MNIKTSIFILFLIVICVYTIGFFVGFKASLVKSNKPVSYLDIQLEKYRDASLKCGMGNVINAKDYDSKADDVFICRDYDKALESTQSSFFEPTPTPSCRFYDDGLGGGYTCLPI